MRKRLIQAAASAALAAFWAAASAGAQSIQVRAVLFYSPTCPHCHTVIENTLLPLQEQYGAQLEILAVNTNLPDGYALFREAMQHYQVPEQRWGVPTLVVGDTVLFGSTEIPERFPGMVEAGLAAGGIDWPALPGLLPEPDTPPEAATSEPATAAVEPGEPELAAGPAEPPPAAAQPPLPSGANPESAGDTLLARLAGDPLGNALAILVLLGMLASFPAIGLTRARRPRSAKASRAGWAVPALAGVGLLVAVYMAFVETTGTEAVCGPVGDCNTVQHSEYALLFGALPIGVFGVVGYVVILATWVLARTRSGRWSAVAEITLLGLISFGVLFSIRLTFLEPFVIGASCAWCLSSAVIITVLLWQTAAPGLAALQRLREDQRRSN